MLKLRKLTSKNASFLATLSSSLAPILTSNISLLGPHLFVSHRDYLTVGLDEKQAMQEVPILQTLSTLVITTYGIASSAFFPIDAFAITNC